MTNAESITESAIEPTDLDAQALRRLCNRWGRESSAHLGAALLVARGREQRLERLGHHVLADLITLAEEQASAAHAVVDSLRKVQTTELETGFAEATVRLEWSWSDFETALFEVAPNDDAERLVLPSAVQALHRMAFPPPRREAARPVAPAKRPKRGKAKSGGKRRK